MWEKTLIESRGYAEKKKWWMFPLAIFVHALVIGVVIGASYWAVEAVQAPPIPVTLYTSAPPPPPPPPAPAKASAPSKPEQPKPVQPVPKEVVQPKVIPEQVEPEVTPEPTTPVTPQDTAPSDTASDSGGGTGVEGGVEGGIEGGVVGGVEGGVVGGIPGGVIGGAGGVVGGTATGDETPMRITADVSKPVLVSKIEPTYPELARKAHIQGVVVLEAVITTSGSVEEVKVLKSLQPTLDQAAMAAVKQWKYKPAMFNGRPVKVYFTVTVTFTLK